MSIREHRKESTDRTRRFDVVLDPCDLYEIWDNETDMPILIGGELAFWRWHEAARVACILNRIQMQTPRLPPRAACISVPYGITSVCGDRRTGRSVPDSRPLA